MIRLSSKRSLNLPPGDRRRARRPVHEPAPDLLRELPRLRRHRSRRRSLRRQQRLSGLHRAQRRRDGRQPRRRRRVRGRGRVASGTAIVGSGRITNGGGIGYLYPMQGGPSYGIGRELDSSAWRLAHPGLPGTLYRETDADCDPASIRSVWTSQFVTEGPLGSNSLPCEALPEGASVDAAKCPDGRNGAAIGDLCLPPADSRCVTADDGGGDLVCACPPGWLDLGSNCCPPGTVAGAPGQCTLANNGQIAAGTPVLDSAGANALAIYEPPFRVNIPVSVDAATQASAPGGFEGAGPARRFPAAPTPIRSTSRPRRRAARAARPEPGCDHLNRRKAVTPCAHGLLVSRSRAVASSRRERFAAATAGRSSPCRRTAPRRAFHRRATSARDRPGAGSGGRRAGRRSRRSRVAP